MTSPKRHLYLIKISKTASRNVLHKATKMINASNSDQRRAATLNLCEEVFSSATEHAEEHEHNIDVILQDQDVVNVITRMNRTTSKRVMMKTLLMTSTWNNIILSRLVLTTYVQYI